jgi:hypothetical protein
LFEGDELAGAGFGGTADSHHLGLAGTIDVRVEEPDTMSFLCQRDGEVGRDGGLADAALTGADGDDVLDPREKEVRWGLSRGGLRRRGVDGEAFPAEVEGGDAGDPGDGFAAGGFDLVLDGSEGGGEEEFEGDVALADLDVAGEAFGEEVAP